MKSNKPYSLLARLSILFVVFVVVAWGGWLWWKSSVSSVDPQDATPVFFVIARGEGTKGVAASLAKQNLIRSPTGFYLLVKLLGIERDIQAGVFRLNKTMDSREIALELTHGTLDVWVTTLEGWRVEEIATKLTKDLDIPEKEFLKYAREGYMFPDTYLVPRDATAAAVAKIFIDNFDKKITSQMRADARKTGLTFPQVVTLASIVEREGRTATDRPVIAGILLNRLKADWPLQVDATLQYILGYQPFEKSWWKKTLSDADKKLVSPYNTYMHTGLPPGPIANPGIESIRAVIYPSASEYFYYLHDPSGQVHYGVTLDDHNANIENYLQ